MCRRARATRNDEEVSGILPFEFLMQRLRHLCPGWKVASFSKWGLVHVRKVQIWASLSLALYILLIFSPNSDLPVNQSCPAAVPQHPVAICVSVIPSRYRELKQRVSALLDQSFESSVFIIISQRYRRNFSDYEVRQLGIVAADIASASNRVSVLLGNDYGPASKLLVPLQHFTEPHIVIIVDDDQNYRKSMVCDLLMLHQKFPRAAITRRSRSLLASCRGTITYTDSVQYNDRTVVSPSRITFEGDLVMGTSGYLVNSNFFDSNIFNYSVCSGESRKYLFYNDDIWISAHLKKRKIPIVTVLTGAKIGGYRIQTSEVERQISTSDGLWRLSTREESRVGALVALRHVFCHGISKEKISCET